MHDQRDHQQRSSATSTHEHTPASESVAVNLNATPRELGYLIRKQPHLARPVIEALHKYRGNAFVQQVLIEHQRATREIIAAQAKERAQAYAAHGATDHGPAAHAVARPKSPKAQAERKPSRENDANDQQSIAASDNSPLGRKQAKLLQWQSEMAEVADELAPKFAPLGLHFRPQILLATALQEADAVDPQNTVSFDNGMGIMQITPYRGNLDPAVARAIGWDNNRSVAHGLAHSNWRDAKANILAGGLTLLQKAKSIARGVTDIWNAMSETQRWRAVMFAYNAGETAAMRALANGGPGARMISTFKNKKGKRVSHDYTAKVQHHLAFVDAHDPFES